jgi:multidomain signaling protein FimX
MEKKAVTHILILAGPDENAEQVINLLRKSGRSIIAHKASRAAELPEIISRGQWDLLLMLTGSVHALLQELPDSPVSPGADLPTLLLSRDARIDYTLLHAPWISEVITYQDADDPVQQALLLHGVQRELTHLHERRELRRTAAALRELEQRHRLLLASTADAIAYLHEGVHVFANAAYMELFGYGDVQEMISVPMLDLVAEDDLIPVKTFLRNQFEMDSRSLEFEALRKDGSRFRAVMDGAAVPYEGERMLQIMIRPASGNIRLKNTIRQIHNRDLLTGLLNRASMMIQIEYAISDAIYELKPSTLLLLRLEHLDEVTLVLGRPAANLLLADIGALLQKLLPDDVLAGRLSANEIAVLIPESGERDHGWTQQWLQSLNQGLRPLVPQTLQLFAQAGSAVVTEDASEAAIVIERARYNIARRLSGSRQTADDDIISAEDILARLRSALEQSSFVLVFQPVVSLHPDGLENYELRIRMPRPEKGEAALLYPPDFLEIANQHGLGEEIDRWVLTQALKLLTQRSTSALRFTVNLTQNAITNGTLLPWLMKQLHDSRQTTEQLILQISELDIISAPEKVADFSRKLEELGIRLSVTHFGGSLEPLRNLDHLPAHFAKLDKVLLQDIDVDARQQEKLHKLVRALQSRGLQVIAPMIDRMELMPFLWQAGVNMVQGNCLQEPSDNMNFTFTQEEEITLRSFN